MNIDKINELLKDNIKDEAIVKDILFSLNAMTNETLNESKKHKTILGEAGTSMNFNDWLHKDIKIKDLPDDLLLEAIIKHYGRPALLVKNGTFETPSCKILTDKLNAQRTNIDNAIKSVGRIELENHGSMPWVGTGWAVRDGIIATNRHVAKVFSWNNGKNLVFKPVSTSTAILKPSVDFNRELYSSLTVSFEIEKVLYLANDSDPDLALLKVKKVNSKSQSFPNLIELDTNISTKINKDIVVIGYPAYDSRTGSIADMDRIFNNIYECKRVQPGILTRVLDLNNFQHDCSTLGGNSGSPIIDIETGYALGIHSSGQYLTTNQAITSKHINNVLDSLK